MEPYSEPIENHAPSATVDTQVALPPSSMSLEQPAVAEPPVRRRIVSAPQRKVTPLALILRERGSLPALEEKLQAARPVVVFPSLSHFCTESHRSERWAGVVVARACAWDARLDDYVADRSLIALYEDAEGYGWPDTVHRLRDDNLEGIDGWLAELDTPRLPVARPKKKRVESSTTPRAKRSRPRAKRSRVVFSLWGAEASVSAQSATGQPAQRHEVASSVNGTASAVAEPPGRDASAGNEKTAARPRVKERAGAKAARARKPAAGRTHKPKAEQQSFSFGDSRAKSQEARAALRDQLVEELHKGQAQKAARASGRQGARPSVGFSRAEEAVARMAVEIGLSRASELLGELRRRAKSLSAR